MVMVGFPSAAAAGEVSVAVAAAAKWLMGEAPRKDCWMSLWSVSMEKFQSEFWLGKSLEFWLDSLKFKIL